MVEIKSWARQALALCSQTASWHPRCGAGIQTTGQELLLKRDLKARILGLSAVEKIRAKQQSRLTMIKAENANSKLFFLRINGRKRKNFIQKLDTDRGVVLDHKGKEEHIHDHFTKLFGTPAHI